MPNLITGRGLRLVGGAHVAPDANGRRAWTTVPLASQHLVQSTDVHYLDLDHDGLVDAVETVETIREEGAPDAAPLAVVRTLEAEIDESGTPRRVFGSATRA